MEKSHEKKSEESEKIKEESAEISDKKDDLRSLVEKNIKWTEVVYEQNRKIMRRLNLMVLANYLRLALIVVPIIFAIIYLPPLLQELWKNYSALIGSAGGQTAFVSDLVEQIGGQPLSDIIKNLPVSEKEQLLKLIQQ